MGNSEKFPGRNAAFTQMPVGAPIDFHGVEALQAENDTLTAALRRSEAERRQMEEALEAAIFMLERISETLSAVYVGDCSPDAGWGSVEEVLRGPPPEGYPIVPELRAALRSSSSTPEEAP